MRKLLRPFLFLVCTLALLAAGCGKKRQRLRLSRSSIRAGLKSNWIRMPGFRFLPFFEETEAIRKKMEAEETDPYVKALLEKDRAQYSKKEASSL